MAIIQRVVFALFFFSTAPAGALTAREAEDYSLIRAEYDSLSHAAPAAKVRQWDMLLAKIAGFKRELKDEQAFDDVDYLTGVCAFQAALAGKTGALEKAAAIFSAIAKEGEIRGELSANALFMLGKIHEQKKEYKDAFKVYSAILTNYADKPVAAKAINRAEHCLAASPRLKAEIGRNWYTPAAGGTRPTQNKTLSGADKNSELANVNIWSAPRSTRFVLEFNGEPEYTYKEYEKEQLLQLDFPRTKSTALVRSFAMDDGLVKMIQVEEQGDAVRVTVQLDKPDDYRVFPLYDPFRLVLDVDGKKKERPAYIGPALTPVNKPAVKTTVIKSLGVKPHPPLPALYKIRTIVIDPGHGGRDPGAVGAGGIKEKDIVLSVALQLEKLLNRNPAYEVFLTRRSDVFVPLEERAAFANQKDADLFISVHVNAGPRSGTDAGFETYYLGPASSPVAELAAQYENGKNVKDINALNSILRQLKKAVKGSESISFASLVQRELVSLLGFPDRGVKTAPFAVLVGTNMPAVLVELGFLSNPGEAKLLKDGPVRRQMALGLYNAVMRYAAN